MKISRLLILTTCCVLCSCGGREQGNRVSNEDGNYSIETLPEWIHEIDGVTTRVSRFASIDGEEVSGTLVITEINVLYDDLDRNFQSQLPSLYTLENFKQIGDGRTEINGSTARWIRLNDSENNVQYTTLQYLIQRPGKKCLLLNCSSTKKNFSFFEEEMNKMVFSLALGH